MCKPSWIMAVAVILALTTPALSENQGKEVKKAIERSTLDQPGTKPFHLKAVLAPSFERDKDSGRTGEVEMWWASPTQWKREVRSPEFHQIEIENGDHDWQKNEGDYFPEWLRETAVELINPVPPLQQVLNEVRSAETRHIGPMTNINWTTKTGTQANPNILRSYVAFQPSTGLLLYAGGFGWGGEFKDYSEFYGRMIARTVNVGSPQVTAKVTTLEKLGDLPVSFFDAAAPGGDPQPLRTNLIDETSLRNNLLPMAPVSWPPLQDGSLQGNVTAMLLIDRTGKVREIGTVVSENSAVHEAGKQVLAAMRFKPFLVGALPVQVFSQFTLPFKTTRPAGVEAFDSPRTYFERGRHAGFPAFGAGSPYMLHAEFDAKSKSGTVEKGRYQDTWLSETQWRREAWFGNSHYVRSRNGDKTYQLAEGDDSGLLRMVFRILEPIPALDTFVESDWRIKRDKVNGVSAVRVLSGFESPDGKLDAEQARGYWFDETGELVKTYFLGIETRRSDFQDFAGTKVAHRIDVLKDEHLAMQIRMTELTLTPVSEKTLDVPEHQWTRAFTDEVR